MLRRPDVARPEAHDRWSPLEYACHVRDVFRIYLDRLDRMLTEDGPTTPTGTRTPPRSERYDQATPAVVAAELTVAAAALADRFDSVAGDQWRAPASAATARRSPSRPSPATSSTIPSTTCGTWAVDRPVTARTAALRWSHDSPRTSRRRRRHRCRRGLDATATGAGEDVRGAGGAGGRRAAAGGASQRRPRRAPPGSLRFWAHLRSAAPRDYLLDEWDYGGYERELDIPDGFGEGIEATLVNGQLVIRLLRGAYVCDIKAQPDGA